MGLSESTSARLATPLDSLSGLFGSVSPDALRRRPPSGKWSAQENLAHVARHHEIFLERIRRILTEDNPRLGSYRPEDDPELGRWMVLPTDEVLRRVKGLRRELIDKIQGLSPDDLNRTGVHTVLGTLAIPTWIEFFLLHEAHHLYVALMRSRGGG